MRPDAIIIGGGIIGGACAFELARAGMRVTVLDRQQPALEASWAAAGMLAPAPESEDALPLVPLGLASLALYPEFVAGVEELCGESVSFRLHGTIHAFFGASAEAERDALLARLRGAGIGTESLSVEAAREREPALSAAAGAALWLPGEGSVDNRRLARAVLAAAARAGADVRAGVTVAALRVERGKCLGVVAGRERLDGGMVVAAAGCYSAQIEGLGRCAPTKPVRGQMAALRAPQAPRVTLRSARGYLVPRADGRWIAGSTSEDAGFEKRVTPEGIAGILSAAVKLAPALATAEVMETWSGLRPDTPDHLPILGPGDVEGLLLATGHYRNGILLAPVTARLVREWATAGRSSIDVTRFSPLRFLQGRASPG